MVSHSLVPGPGGPGGTVTHPSPVRAQQPCMCHGWSWMALRVRNWEVSMVVMESFRSCLLAKIRTEASRRACGQRSPAPVSLPGPNLPPQCPLSVPWLPCCPSKRSPTPSGVGMGACLNIATPASDTDSSQVPPSQS